MRAKPKRLPTLRLHFRRRQGLGLHGRLWLSGLSPGNVGLRGGAGQALHLEHPPPAAVWRQGWLMSKAGRSFFCRRLRMCLGYRPATAARGSRVMREAPSSTHSILFVRCGLCGLAGHLELLLLLEEGHHVGQLFFFSEWLPALIACRWLRRLCPQAAGRRLRLGLHRPDAPRLTL